MRGEVSVTIFVVTLSPSRHVYRGESNVLLSRMRAALGGVTMLFLYQLPWMQRLWDDHWNDVSSAINSECDAIAVCDQIEAVGHG
jgi:hypothetical protein